ncbi:MAG: N-6 DNA methylase [Pseudomonadota bacterium]
MSAPKPIEQLVLTTTEKALDAICRRHHHDSFETRMQVLEAAACRLGGIPLSGYFNAFAIEPVVALADLEREASTILSALTELPMHPSLALSALAREPLQKQTQRSSGAYHTDFRLAQYISEIGCNGLNGNSKVLDPACGAGILLAAVAVTHHGARRGDFSSWLSRCVYAVDVSPVALRGARLALASLTDDLNAVISMWANFRCMDSLMATEGDWKELSQEGFDLVIGNPPWEKVKLTRHEYLQANGAERHYGATYRSIDSKSYEREKANVASYAKKLVDKFDLGGSGEPDLYMAFLHLATELVRPCGTVAILVPAGLIRSSGTEDLRKYLFHNAEDLKITIFDNKSKFFAIDTRFKFLALSYSRPRDLGTNRKGPISLRHATGTPRGVELNQKTRIARSSLRKMRADLTLPEVRSEKEWCVFERMANTGIAWSDPSSTWYPVFAREVDMTRERKHFVKSAGKHTLPVVEGRMVQAHRFGAKAYDAGTGRRAIWTRLPPGESQVIPQFYIDQRELSRKALERSELVRVGFCDIAGQTNERSMNSAIVPAGVVCGNKVPTVVFPNDPSEERLHLWVGITNSIPFDWMLRRVLTTTVNYFLLLGLPLPKLEPSTLSGSRLAELSRDLADIDSGHSPFSPWEVAKLRADADILVLIGYGLGFEELQLMLEDFPILDRGQPALADERVSTITRDFLLSRAAKRFKVPAKDLDRRVAAARGAGAIPYVPSEFAETVQKQTVYSEAN